MWQGSCLWVGGGSSVFLVYIWQLAGMKTMAHMITWPVLRDPLEGFTYLLAATDYEEQGSGACTAIIEGFIVPSCLGMTVVPELRPWQASKASLLRAFAMRFWDVLK